MESQALEQMLDNVFIQNRMYNTIDKYDLGTTAFYSGKPLDPLPRIEKIGGRDSPSGVLLKPDYLKGAVERFRKPEFDEKNKFHMNYEIVVPGIKKPIINKHILLGDD